MNQASTGWPPASGVTGWGQVPQNLMPKRTQAWPRGTQSTANDAERLLSTAVGWWDAAWYDGSRFLRNRGVAGELLDMRLGSSLAVNSNDPLFLAPELTGYVYLPGVASNYLSVPDENALDITGDLDIRVRLGELNIATSNIIAKGAAAGQISWILYFNTARVALLHSADGTNYVNTAANCRSTVDLTGFGPATWLKATLDVDDGAGNHVIRYWTSTDGQATWTELGTARTLVGVTSVFSSTSAVVIGGGSAVTATTLAARLYRAIVKDGIDGTTVLDVDCDALTDRGATSFTAATGQTVTINRATSGRKSVAQPARGRGGRALFLLGTDDFFEVQDNWQHQLLNFGQGDSFTVLAVVRQWATPVSFGYYIAKQGDLPNANIGWGLASNGTNLTLYGRIHDGTTQAGGGTSLAYTTGAMSVLAMVSDRASKQLSRYANAGAPSTVSSSAVGNAYANLGLRVGRNASTGYQDMEFTSAAIFRRALTAAEITTLTTYFTNRGF